MSPTDTTTEPHVSADRFAVGDEVRTLPTVRPSHHADRSGTVAARHAGEIGISFAKIFGPSSGSEAWFLPGELVLVKVPETTQEPAGGPQDVEAAR